MHRKYLLLLGGVVSVLVAALVIISVHVQGITPVAGVPPLAACTPTPAVRAPYPTLSPDEQKTPGIGQTAITRYQATHPGDVHNPKKVTDLAPQLAKGDKPEVIVRDPDCTYEGFLIAPDQPSYDSLIKSLPANTTAVSMLPAQNTLRHTVVPGPSGPAGTPGVFINHQGTPMTTIPTPPFPIPPTPNFPLPLPPTP